MSKLFLWAIIALAVIGVVTGVIQVKINPDKLGTLPTTISQAVGSGNILSQAQYYFTTWKRKVEIAIANSDDKKFELYMKYVEQDTKSLKEALDAKKSPDVIITQSKLLNESLAQAKAGVEKISDEAIHTVQDTWLKVLASANTELGRLSGLADQYKQYQENIEKLAPAPQGEARPDGRPSSQVTPTPAIELKF